MKSRDNWSDYIQGLNYWSSQGLPAQVLHLRFAFKYDVIPDPYHSDSTIMYANLFGNTTSFQTLYMLQGTVDSMHIDGHLL